MSVTSSSRQHRFRTRGVNADDSGNEWEIGDGNPIVDLDGNLEKDRQRTPMNRVMSVKSATEGREELENNYTGASVAFDGLVRTSEHPCLCKDSRKFKLKRRNSTAADTVRVPDVETASEIAKGSGGKRRDAQGRGGEINSAPAAADSSPDEPAPGARARDAKRGKSLSKTLKRDKPPRKDKPGDALGPLTENLSCRGRMDRAIVEQPELSVQTRSVGTNTQDMENRVESSYTEPCQPGTSVNLEGIVWHETEEGVLVVNVTWRKRTYVGTLLDCTKHDWAPPRFCESPSSDSDLTCSRGRGKRMRLSVPDPSAPDPALPKVRGLTHRRRGVGMGSKGRRGSLNLSACRSPGYYTIDDIKSDPLACGKRKGKAPADLDLSLVSEDVRNGNGKRIRAKSRSAPSTPQGKSDSVFLDPVCSSPMLIDCPHPNCNKKYKHINGLRYHQSHAHLSGEDKQEFEAESEDRLSDFDEALGSVPFDSPESIIAKKPRAVFNLSVAAPKFRKALLGSDTGPVACTKMRKHVTTKDGALDDLSNLPLISNMSVVLENCLIADRSTSVEMPKLEAEGAIDKRAICGTMRKEGGAAERCSSKSRNNRLSGSTPAPPKLTAIPPTGFSCRQASPTVALTKAKNVALKPIKPKLEVVAHVNTSNAAVLNKDDKRKEKHRLKERNLKDPKSPKIDLVYLKQEDVKSASKEFPVSLLKEHLSKQDVLSHPSERQESRMASIRAEADKVYTFSDNAPSPSIGSSTRMDCGPLSNGDGAGAKTNSPAYSDISDAAEDGGSNSRSRRNSTQDASSNVGLKIPSAGPAISSGKEISPSCLSHGFDSHCVPGHVHSTQANSSCFLKVASPYTRTKEDLRDLNDELKALEPSAQFAETHTALAQSLYYGQYSRGMVSGNQRALVETCCEEPQFSKHNRGPARPQDRVKEEQKPSVHKAASAVKVSCGKPGFLYVDLDKQQGKSTHVSLGKEQGLNTESAELSLDSSNSKSSVDTNVTFLNASESRSWSHTYQSKYVTQQSQEVGKISGDLCLSPDKGKDWHVSVEPESRLEVQSLRGEEAAEAREDGAAPDTMEVPEETGRSSPQQPFLPFQHSYPYLHLCDGGGAYRVMSPTLVHNYPGFHYPMYGKTAGREDVEVAQCSKAVTDSSSLELLSHPLLPYQGKSPVPGERGSPEQEREAVAFGRHLQTHHLGMSYTLLSGQFDPFAGEES